jgi:hypothetical protein
MGPIAATLLCYFDPEVSRAAFYRLVLSHRTALAPFAILAAHHGVMLDSRRFDTDVARRIASRRVSVTDSLQRVYALLVRLHDDYGMHSILAPGFPGLLEAFYVQERLMEWLMPDVFQSFVSSLPTCATASQHEYLHHLGVGVGVGVDVDEAFPLTSQSRNMISSSAWGTKWYITLFVNTVPFSQQLRLWDAIWLDGRDVVIMTSVAILWAFKGGSKCES